MEILGIVGPMEIMIIVMVCAASLLFLVPWIMVLVDIVKSDFEGDNKIVWVLVVALTGVIGAIIYFIAGTKQKIRPDKK